VKWSDSRKKSVDCKNPKGFSEKAHCAGRKKKMASGGLAIKSLSPQEYAATTKAKRAGKAKGKQFVAQPKSIKQKVKPFRKI